MPDLFYIVFLFVLGACIGSFLNVVAYRIPAGISLISPPSHCPKCKHKLAWYDNIPVFGWIFLAGRCRYCQVKISPRYPLVEFFCGLLFALMYVAVVNDCGPFFSVHDHFGNLTLYQRMQLNPGSDWPLFSLYLFAAATLLAISLIDFDLYLIPRSLPLLMAIVGAAMHTLFDHRPTPGALIGNPSQLALAAGAGIGLLISIALLQLGILPLSFAEGESPLEIEKIAHEKKTKDGADEEFLDYSPSQVRAEIRKEMLFIAIPLVFAVVSMMLMHVPSIARFWLTLDRNDHIAGFFGSLLGALVGGGIIWIIRIFGSYLFGKEAMGLGDIDLMFGVGAVIGAFYVVVAFFLSPFFALPLALLLWAFTGRRQIPYGPYLSAATLFIMLFPFPFHEFIMPGLQGLDILLPSLLHF